MFMNDVRRQKVIFSDKTEKKKMFSLIFRMVYRD